MTLSKRRAIRTIGGRKTTEEKKAQLLKLREELVTKSLCDAFLGWTVVGFIENWNKEREKENDICKGEKPMTTNDNAKHYNVAPKSFATMSKAERHMDLCMKLNDIYARKNKDYGDSFHETFVEEGLAMSRIRLADKFQRFKTLSKKVDMTGRSG